MCLETFLTSSTRARNGTELFYTHVLVTPCSDFLSECEEAQALHEHDPDDYIFCPNLDTFHAGIYDVNEHIVEIQQGLGSQTVVEAELHR